MTMIIAHRGASKVAPENTMPAFELALRMKAEAIETDVQLTKDNIPVLIHDEHVKRTTNSHGYIKDYHLAELKKLDAGSWFSKNFGGATILTLEEFLQWMVNTPLHLHLELKNNKIDYMHLEPIVYELLSQYKVADRTTISTFNPDSVQRFSQLSSTIEIALLTSRKINNLPRYAKELGAKAVHIKYRLLNKKLIQQCQHENMRVRVYTVNQFSSMMRCFRIGCDGIFTDVPNKAILYRNLT
ncbi:glycerophosphodiester phosphodiesterase [Oceanobacillus sp. FSL K6-2867]|uniref:glycerophosphodiester phosphodiesterase n=1 Tax=Oceanobacillus sp. FSL K6-2867 TaxID=2954748 RepID=UPI0030D73189